MSGLCLVCQNFDEEVRFHMINVRAAKTCSSRSLRPAQGLGSNGRGPGRNSWWRRSRPGCHHRRIVLPRRSKIALKVIWQRAQVVAFRIERSVCRPRLWANDGRASNRRQLNMKKAGGWGGIVMLQEPLGTNQNEASHGSCRRFVVISRWQGSPIGRQS